MERAGPHGFVPCYICGKKVGRHSLVFHEPRCYQRLQEHKSYQKKKKQTLQRRAASRSIPVSKCRTKCKTDQSANQVNLFVKCHICKRNVSRHSLESHLPKCMSRRRNGRKKSRIHEKQLLDAQLHQGNDCYFSGDDIADVQELDLQKWNRVLKITDEEHESVSSEENDGRPKTRTLSRPSSDLDIPIINTGTQILLKSNSPEHSKVCNTCNAEKFMGDGSLQPTTSSKNDQAKPKMNKVYRCRKEAVSKQISQKSPNEVSHSATYSAPMNTEMHRGPKCSKMEASFDSAKEKNTNKSNMITCYICNRRIFLKVAQLHEAYCVERWLLKNMSHRDIEHGTSYDSIKCQRCSDFFPLKAFIPHQTLCGLKTNAGKEFGHMNDVPPENPNIQRRKHNRSNKRSVNRTSVVDSNQSKR